MSRIPEVSEESLSPRVRAVLDAQRTTYGAPLSNHLLYAHNEDVFRGVRAMWSALDKAGGIEPSMTAVINRRVATKIGCVF